MKIPTAITRYTPIIMEDSYIELRFKRTINTWDKEDLQVYNKPHIVVRWSPIRVAYSRMCEYLNNNPNE